ncbi:MAG: hypothetical protein ACE1ZC_02230 [Nitrososphaerales archaeon]
MTLEPAALCTVPLTLQFDLAPSAQRSIDPSAVPSKPGVFVIENEAGITLALAATANLRRAIRTRLNEAPLLKWRSQRKLRSDHPVYGHLTPYKGTFATVIGELLSFLRGERDGPPVDPGEGLQAIQVLEAARESIQTGRVEKVVR